MVMPENARPHHRHDAALRKRGRNSGHRTTAVGPATKRRTERHDRRFADDPGVVCGDPGTGLHGIATTGTRVPSLWSIGCGRIPGNGLFGDSDACRRYRAGSWPDLDSSRGYLRPYSAASFPMGSECIRVPQSLGRGAMVLRTHGVADQITPQ